MKKFFAAAIASVIIAFSAVPAFAAVNSPQGTPTTEPSKDKSTTSPKTGSSDVALYSAIALSVAACGAASVVLAKAKK